MTFFHRILALCCALALGLTLAACGGLMPGSKSRGYQPINSSTVAAIERIGSAPGRGTMIRIFKESSELELWKETATGTYKLFKTYEICAWSGVLGPKVKEGDRQSPEGFYNITPALLNPNSNYYLSFDTGFPNKFDRAHGRTGSDLMIHGDCSSRGCYSMTDEAIAEIYAIVRESFEGGNATVQLQIFPFRMTPANIARHADNPNMTFWRSIKEGYDRFEIAHVPPSWDVCEKRYVFGPTRETAQALEAAGTCPAPSASDTMIAALTKKQADDDAAVKIEVAALEAKAAAEAEAAAKEAARQAELKARGDALGNFVGSIFGGGGEPVEKTMDPSLIAPIPAPPIRRG